MREVVHLGFVRIDARFVGIDARLQRAEDVARADKTDVMNRMDRLFIRFGYGPGTCGAKGGAGRCCC